MIEPNGNGLPNWIKIAAQVGFPMVVAAWFIWVANDRIANTANAMQAHIAQAELQTALLRAICRNGAKDIGTAQFCDRIGLPMP